MADDPPDDPADEWRNAEPTVLDGDFLDDSERDTGPVTLGVAGFCEGHDLGFKHGVGAAMLALRDELIAGGTDAGVAALVAQKLGRACGVRGG